MHSAQLIRYYYLSSPLYLIFDLLFASRFRVYIPDDYAGFYYPYLFLSFFLGGFLFKSSLASSLFAILESSFCLFLLILSIWLPTVTSATDPELVKPVSFGTDQLINFALCSFILLFGFYTNPLIKRQDST